MLLWFNVANLWNLVARDQDGILAVFLLWFLHGIVFAGVQFAFAVMMMARKDDDDGRSGGLAIWQFVRPLVALTSADNARRNRRG